MNLASRTYDTVTDPEANMPACLSRKGSWTELHSGSHRQFWSRLDTIAYSVRRKSSVAEIIITVVKTSR